MISPKLGLAAAAPFVLFATPGLAQPLTVVPPAERLTAGDVFMDASMEMKLVMAILTVVILAEIALWAMSLMDRGQAPREAGRKLAAIVGRFASAAPLLGLFGMSYVLLNGALGVSNVRPA